MLNVQGPMLFTISQPLYIPGFIAEQSSEKEVGYSVLESPKINVITCSNYLRVVRMLETAPTIKPGLHCLILFSAHDPLFLL